MNPYERKLVIVGTANTDTYSSGTLIVPWVKRISYMILNIEISSTDNLTCEIIYDNFTCENYRFSIIAFL
jgi:hypothetical protein